MEGDRKLIIGVDLAVEEDVARFPAAYNSRSISVTQLLTQEPNFTLSSDPVTLGIFLSLLNLSISGEHCIVWM